jgi:eukaryotic-like serine/threonine-protein kinase
MDQGRYEIVDVVGSGGMATVWRARDTRLGRVVAVKRPHPAPAGAPVLQRFAREARAAATVHHPNLVSVFDVGEDEVGPYLVMEFVDGPSLAEATVPPADVATIGTQLASALAALHDAGIVHGDVKPGNILVAGTGVKLTDFGIARTGDDTALTQEGMVVATPRYAAPETLAGSGRTPAGDVYALAAVLHELVTGGRWDPASGSTQTMPPAAWAPVLGPALRDDPDRRPSAAALGAQLAELADEPTTASPTSPPPAISGGDRRNGRAVAAVVAAVAVALFAVVGLAALRGGDDLDAVFVASTEPTVTVAEATPVPATEPLPAEPPPTDPPPTDPPPPPPPPAPAPALVAELVALLDREVAEGMDRRDADRIVRDVERAVTAAESGRQEPVHGALRDALGRIDREVDDDARTTAVALVRALAVELGVDPDRLRAPPGRGGGNGRGDDDRDDD